MSLLCLLPYTRSGGFDRSSRVFRKSLVITASIRPHTLSSADRFVSSISHGLESSLQGHRLVMAPVYFSAFVYIVLGMAINRMGQQYSVLTPRMVGQKRAKLIYSTLSLSSSPTLSPLSFKLSEVVKLLQALLRAHPPNQQRTSW